MNPMFEGINRPWQVETHGINKIPESARNGNVKDLFWIWFAANIGILGVVYGAVVLSFGLNFLQSLLVIILGSASFLVVGVFSVAGRDGGAPMMTLSRKVFGIYGNIFPNIVSWLSLVGWETITVITGTFALSALLSIFWHTSYLMSSLAAMVLMLIGVIAAGLLGQATLVVIQTWASYVFGAMTLLIIALIIPQTHWHNLLARPEGPWLTGVLPALSIVIAGTGLSWVNAAADYSRYLSKREKSGSIIWATTLGGGIPLFALMVVGLLLATRVPLLAESANPIQVIRGTLPQWAAVPYLVTAAAGLVAEGDLSLYSSGLNLLNMFVPVERYKTVLVDAVIMTLGTVYVVLIAQDFLGPFESFVTLFGIGLASWAGVFLADQLTEKKVRNYPSRLLFPDEHGSLRKVRWPALMAWIMGIIIGILFTTSPFFTGWLAQGIFADSGFELIFAFLLGASSFLILKPILPQQAATEGETSQRTKFL